MADRLTEADYHPLELAGGYVRGTAAVTALATEAPLPARRALEAAVLPALLRPPCVVSFSGGRDSSTVLALATSVARAEGLPLPVPVTLRFAGDVASHETEWQDLMVRHLGLDDWERLELADEVDVVGPYAEHVLSRFGLLFPVNAHFHVPIAARARGGSLLTGVGGDEVLSAARYRRLNAVRMRHERPGLRVLGSAVAAYGPARLRAAAVRRREDYRIPWLTEGAERELVRWRARSISRQEVRWDRWITRSWWQDRGRVLGERSLAAIASEFDAVTVHPFSAPGVLVALAAERGAAGFRSRREALDHLAGDLLPPGFSGRTTKAAFNASFFGHRSRALVAAWDGTGFDPDVIDADRLRRAWSAPRVDARSQWLLQVLRLRQLLRLEGLDEDPDAVLGG